MDCIRALDEFEGKVVVVRDYLPLPGLKIGCNCCQGARYCQAVWDQDQFLIDSFGCGHAKLMAKFFKIHPDEPEAFFKRALRVPV